MDRVDRMASNLRSRLFSSACSRCLLSALLMLALPLAAFAQDNSPYGVHSHVARGDEYPFLAGEMDLMQQAGIGWLRTGFVWSQIEGSSGERDYRLADDVVAQAAEHGIRIMGLLHGAPERALPIVEHLDGWLEFVRTTVERYKGRVPAWQIWNEPNLDQFWKDPNPEHYAALLKATYPAIKSIDPDATVVWGATSMLDWNFLEPALTSAGDVFDVMAIHPYGYEDPRAPAAYIPDALDELRGLLRRHGLGDKPIWFTEWGWPTHTGQRGISDRQQGQYIARAHIVALHAGLARSFWYEFQERAVADEINEDAFGILEFDLKPKPAYKAYATLIAVRPPGSVPVAGTWKTGLVYHPAWTRPDGVVVHAVWDIWGRWKSPRKVPVRIDGTIQEAKDYLGVPMELEMDAEGRTLLPLDWGSPLYIVGPTRIAFE